MTHPDRAAVRRDITAALEAAFERRHDVLEAIVEAKDRESAVASVATLLSVPAIGAEAVLGMSFDRLTVSARRSNAAELEDLNSKLTFTQTDRPASTSETLSLRPFDDSDSGLFAQRTEDVGAAGDGSGSPASRIDDEISAANIRMRAEEAVWLVAEEGTNKVGLVFGELSDGEVQVRIWVAPEHRKNGYGTAALRRSRSELAAYFPGVPLVIRTPSS